MTADWNMETNNSAGTAQSSAAHINGAPMDRATSLNGTHFLLSAVEYVACHDKRYFVHLTDDNFCEVDYTTFAAWAAQNTYINFPTEDYTLDDLAGESSGQTVFLSLRTAAVVAVIKLQRKTRKELHRYELYTAAGYTLLLETEQPDIADIVIPQGQRVGKFLVWNYEPRYRQYCNEAWVMTLRTQAIESVKVVDRHDVCFVDLFFKNGHHYVGDVIVDQAMAADIEAMFLGSTVSYFDMFKGE
jgi:hypothetical protein